MRRLALALVPVIAGYSLVSAWPDELVVLAGQSNAGVYNLSSADLPPATFRPTPRVQILTPDGFRDLDPGRDTGLPKNPHVWGPEVGFAAAWLKHHKIGVLYIVKSAKGSTGLAKAETASWDPDAQPASLFAETTRRVTLARQATGLPVAAVLWMQGEEDAEHQAAASVYRPNLARLLSRMRRDWGADHIVLGRIGAGLPYAALVRTAQEQVAAADSRTALVDTDRLPRQPDRLHLAAAGALELGREFYVASVNCAGQWSVAHAC